MCSPIAAGHPATTAGCAPTTPSSTSWDHPSRPRGAARAPARTSLGAARCRSGSWRPPVRGDTGHPIRLRFTKQGKVRFVSHRDVARAVERAIRIEALPVAFTQGSSPRPKVSFGLALAVGHESRAEYLDLELRDPIDPA